MKRRYRPLALLLVVAGRHSLPECSSAQNKPNIVILATGGTIAGAAATGTQSHIRPGL